MTITSKALQDSVLREVLDDKIGIATDVVVVYPGRFQPFHKGHYKTYQYLVNKFGADKVYISTSNFSGTDESPFTFVEKKQIMQTLYGIPEERIIRNDTPYSPPQMLFSGNEAFIVALGDKDKNRLVRGDYFSRYRNDNELRPYTEKGYYIIAPAAKDVSGSKIRKTFTASTDEKTKKAFVDFFGKFNQDIYYLVMDKIGRLRRESIIKAALLLPEDHPAHKIAVSMNLITEHYLLLREGVHDPGILKAIILAGGPGSGKSYTSSKLFGIPSKSSFASSGLKVVNSDNAFEFLLKKNGYDLDLSKLPKDEFDKLTSDEPGSIRHKAKKITDIFYDRWKSEKLGMIIDKTASHFESVQALKKELEEQGYDVDMVFVKTSLDVALRRNAARDRKLPDHLVKQIWEEVMQNLKRFKKEFGDEFHVIDNSGTKDFSLRVNKLAHKMVNTPVKNPKGRSWITGELQVMSQHGGQRRSSAQFTPGQERQQLFKSALRQRIKNPETKHNILVKSALSYSKDHPVYKAAVDLVRDFIRSVKQEAVMISRALFLTEGGAYGKIQHPFEDAGLTFGDLRNLIELGLDGRLDIEAPATEKTDGQNILISYRDDKGVIFARNKSHLVNHGAGAMSTSDVKSFFAGRGDISDAFSLAADDLEAAITSLPDAQKIFDNGQKFMSVEILYPATQNVVPYGLKMLVFHGTIDVDEKGNKSETNMAHASLFAKMIKDANLDIQHTFQIRGPNIIKFPREEDYARYKARYFSWLDRIQNEFDLADSDPVSAYHVEWWKRFIINSAVRRKYSLPNTVLQGLLTRWAHLDTSYKITDMKSDIRQAGFLEWALDFDKNNKQAQFKQNMQPLEDLFFSLGARILKNASGYLAALPMDVGSVQKQIDQAANELEKGGDPAKISKFRNNLQRLEDIGIENIIPSEGVIFVFKGKTYKLTGSFAHLSQLLQVLKF